MAIWLFLFLISLAPQCLPNQDQINSEDNELNQNKIDYTFIQDLNHFTVAMPLIITHTLDRNSGIKQQRVDHLDSKWKDYIFGLIITACCWATNRSEITVDLLALLHKDLTHFVFVSVLWNQMTQNWTYNENYDSIDRQAFESGANFRQNCYIRDFHSYSFDIAGLSIICSETSRPSPENNQLIYDKFLEKLIEMFKLQKDSQVKIAEVSDGLPTTKIFTSRNKTIFNYGVSKSDKYDKVDYSLDISKNWQSSISELATDVIKTTVLTIDWTTHAITGNEKEDEIKNKERKISPEENRKLIHVIFGIVGFLVVMIIFGIVILGLFWRKLTKLLSFRSQEYERPISTQENEEEISRQTEQSK